MKNIVIIAEKPSVASSIAKVVGANVPHRDKACGYLEGNGYAVTWAFGHLVRLKNPEHMGFAKNVVPLIPERWETQIISKKNKEGKEETDELASKQLQIIKELFNKASRIIVATDAGREGELIFRYIYEYLECTTPFYRLWISSLTDEAIRKGLNDIREGSEFQSLSDAAHARSQADWLVGFNSSRAIRMATGFKGLLSLGRVQTPTLGLICTRYEAHINFTPTPYWQIKVETEKKGIEFSVNSEKKYSEPTIAEEDARRTRQAQRLKVISVEKKSTTSKPPLLHDLTSLQRIANTKYGLTAEETLKAAQSLYEKKLLSYPRTGSRFIPEDVYRTIPGLIEKLVSYEPFMRHAQALKDSRLYRRSVNDSKVTDHHALLPTGQLPTELSINEKRLYDLVCGRMLEAFGEESIANVTKVLFDANGVVYTARGSVPVHMGWKSVFGCDEQDKEAEVNEENDYIKLPELTEGDTIPAEKVEVLQKSDKPLPIYTDSSLLGEMETCGKKIEDEILKESMKDCGLGTPATRASIIEALITRNYVYRNNKKIIPTDLGMQIWQMVKGRKISDVQMTGEWERDLSRIEQGQMNVSSFNKEIQEFVIEVLEDLKENCKSLDGVNLLHEPVRECPVCGFEMINMRYSISCNPDKGGCGFKINREIAGKKITDSAINAICTRGNSGLLKGFTSKSGKKFNAYIKVNKEERKLEFEFETAQAIKTDNLQCPVCGKGIIDTGRTITCNSCNFKLWKTQRGITLSEIQILALLEGKKVKVTGMISSKNTKYNGKLHINKANGVIECEFTK